MHCANPILNTDSYKASHWRQYPPGTTHVSSYIECRGSSLYPRTVFFGLQMFLKEYLCRAVTREHIDEAAEVWAAHGLPFNREDWEYLVDRHGGRLPLEIEAVPEGSVVPIGNIL